MRLYVRCLLPCVCSIGWLDDWLSRASEKKVDSGQKSQGKVEPVAKKSTGPSPHVYFV